MRKQFSNEEILLYAEKLNKIFLHSENEIELPIKINFYLQKNITAFMEAAKEIEAARLNIGQKYGRFDEKENSYFIEDEEKLKLAKKDLKDLLSLEQILEIYMVSLSELENTTSLTVTQMNAMLFMIDEDIEY